MCVCKGEKDKAMKFVNVCGIIIVVYFCIVGVTLSHDTDYELLQQQSINDAVPSKILSPRIKRTLVYPVPSTLLLIFGLGTPLQLDRESVIVGAFTKMIYTLPTNSTTYTEPGIEYTRTKSRWSLYKTLAQLAEIYDFGDGKSCVLRAICEAASVPFDRHQGLMHHLLQVFLSPSSTKEKYEENGDQEYEAAERLGEHVGENCHAQYPECRRSFLDVFSTVQNSLFS